MSTKKVKEYAPEFKFKVVLEMLKQESTQIELSQKYGIPTCTLRSWYNQFIENGEAVFTGRKFIEILLANGIIVSMDGKGRAFDNIHIERYWRSYKYESVFLKNYKNLLEARLETAKYVKFYNSRRFHASLLYKTPDRVYYENLHLSKNYKEIQTMIA